MTEEERYHLKEERVKQSNSFINKEQSNSLFLLVLVKNKIRFLADSR